MTWSRRNIVMFYYRSLIFLLKYLKLPSITYSYTDLCHSVIAIQKIDISLHAVTAILYKVFQGDGGCAK